MLEQLSTLVRKPSKIDEAELDKIGWTSRRNKVLDYMDRDQVLQRLLADFKIVNDRLKQIRSTRDVKIYYTELEKAGTYYTPDASSMLMVSKQNSGSTWERATI